MAEGRIFAPGMGAECLPTEPGSWRWLVRGRRAPGLVEQGTGGTWEWPHCHPPPFPLELEAGPACCCWEGG